MTFHEEWFSEGSQQVLADLAAGVTVPGRIVEIGCWEGRSTVALANAVHPRIVHAVDHWNGSAGEPSEQLAAKRDVFAQWQSNVAELTEGNVEPHRMGWRDYHALYDTPVAFLFVDGPHTYAEVAGAIDAFAPLMSPGGIMCGDDAHHPPVHQAVLERYPKAGWHQSLWIVK